VPTGWLPDGLRVASGWLRPQLLHCRGRVAGCPAPRTDPGGRFFRTVTPRTSLFFRSLDILVWSTRRVAEGSRRSPRVFWGGDLRATAQEEAQHPGWGARPASEPDRADERAALAPFLGAPLSDAAFRWSLTPCPERPPATLYQPGGLASATEFRRISHMCEAGAPVSKPAYGARTLHSCPFRCEPMLSRFGNRRSGPSALCANYEVSRMRQRPPRRAGSAPRLLLK
jgi:hypothetical protein